MTDAYNACLNYTAAETAGLEPLVGFIDLIVKAFPEKASDGLITKDDDLGKVMLVFAQHSIPTFEFIQPVKDAINPVSLALDVVQYRPAASIKAEELALKITAFEEEANQLLNADRRSETADIPIKFTLADVTSVAPELGHDFVIKSLSPPGYIPEELNFAPGYFGNLSALLANTTADTLKGYFVWKAAITLSTYVEAEAMHKLTDVKAILSGLDPDIIGQGARWQQCIARIEGGVGWIETSNGLGWILGRFFIDRAYSEAARELTTTLMNTIQREFITRLADKTWLSDEVRKVAEEKVRAMALKIGYPDASPKTVDPQGMAAYYRDLEIGESFFNNTISSAAWYTAKLWSSLNKPSDKAMWGESPTVVNAYYSPQLNDITILAGIQQQPLYDVEYPSYINYGGLGTVLGHELTHGFDNVGHKFAPNGSLSNWFDESSEKAFTERAGCFVKQYSEFSVAAPNGTRVHVKGDSTLGENIADAGGLAASFAAWKRQQADGTANDYDLPGLGNFTYDQLFFVKYAQSWCTVSGSPGYDVWLINNDAHSPGFARIKGGLDNTQEFKKAFNCPVKEARCELW
ncbi:neprilysin-1 [Colletotrichum spaethianum]|uniref:Neprilysin-1 n=1 Tax=Colletotrichum spaethianum TaxID=700344 RepID=A0AA37P701_9PEZI|nr:neprilysin-1 [Colletotrichum spaethianum]GKT41329.1 neprilysin-1 [Colletotrichum spaethianum]